MKLNNLTTIDQDNIKPIENDINEAESAIKKIKNTIKQLTSSLDKKESKL